MIIDCEFSAKIRFGKDYESLLASLSTRILSEVSENTKSVLYFRMA